MKKKEEEKLLLDGDLVIPEEKKIEMPEPKSTFVAAVIKEPTKLEPEPMRSINPNKLKAAEVAVPPVSVKFCDYGLGDKVCSRCGSKKITGTDGQIKCAIASSDCPFLKK